MTRLALYCGNIEPSIDELLSDPIIHLLMKRDGVSAHQFRYVMEAARRQLPFGDRGRSPALPAEFEAAKS